jgi:hypothetical protein
VGSSCILLSLVSIILNKRRSLTMDSFVVLALSKPTMELDTGGK